MALQCAGLLFILSLHVHVMGQNRNCYLTENGSDYSGTANVTKSGRNCQRWDSLHQENIPYEQLFGQNNYCRNPDSSRRPWCYTANGDWEYCEVYNCEGLTECYMTTQGIDYFGTKNMTVNGKACQQWSAQEPHNHRFAAMSKSKNYCRNPDYEPGPWCYTNQSDTRWELCGVPKCNITEDTCYRSGKAYLYTGKINITESGYPCQRWDSQTPNRHIYDSFREHENYCRTPDGGNVPWCYSTNPTERWEKCNIVPCGEDDALSCPDKWSKFGSNCYLIGRKTVTLSEAAAECKASKSDLVSVLSAKEHQYIYSKIYEDLCINALNDTDCNNRSSNGECASNFIFMTKNCRKTCGRCGIDCSSEASGNCGWWADAGECIVNPRYMLVNCAKACKTCQKVYETNFWIGLSRKNDQTLQWSDGQSVVAFNISSGMRYPPANMNGTCFSIRVQNGTWWGSNCNDSLSGYVCKQPKKVIHGEKKYACTMEYNGKCYSFHTKRLSWLEAENFCVTNESGHLAAVSDGYVQAFITSEMPGKYKDFWIGLKGTTSGYTAWTNGENLTFSFWDPAGVRGRNDTCATIQQQERLLGLWRKSNCTDKHPFICENSTDSNDTNISLPINQGAVGPERIPSVGNSQIRTALQTVKKFQMNGCRSGWQAYQSNCYKKLFHQWNWEDGKGHCKTMDSDLASIHSAGEENFIKTTFLRDEGLWIGLKINSNNVLSWSDNSAVNYTKIAGNGNSQKKCLSIVNRTRPWRYNQCSVSFEVLCMTKRRVSCGDPPIVENAVITSGSNSIGSSITYTCNDGYTPGSGSKSVSCSVNFEWSPTQMSCNENCYRPDEPYYGNFYVSETGKECVYWNLDNPRTNYYRSYPNAVENYCRDYEHTQPWCYVNSVTLAWENCNVPQCVDEQDETSGLVQQLQQAEGKADTITDEFKGYLGAIVSITCICLVLLAVVTAFAVYFSRLLKPSDKTSTRNPGFENALYLNNADSTINPDTDQLCVNTISGSSSSTT